MRPAVWLKCDASPMGGTQYELHVVRPTHLHDGRGPSDAIHPMDGWNIEPVSDKKMWYESYKSTMWYEYTGRDLRGMDVAYMVKYHGELPIGEFLTKEEADTVKRDFSDTSWSIVEVKIIRS